MLSEVLAELNRFTDLEEEKDLMEWSEKLRGKRQLQWKGWDGGCRSCSGLAPGLALNASTHLLPLRQAEDDIALDVLQVESGHGWVWVGSRGVEGWSGDRRHQQRTAGVRREGALGALI